jgi:hypothetical protein
MPERTYTGPFASGAADLPTRRLPFVKGEPVEVTAEEADLLDQNPDWGGSTVDDDLAGLDKQALLDIADAEGFDVNTRLGAPRLADEIRQARLDKTAEDDSDDKEQTDG